MQQMVPKNIDAVKIADKAWLEPVYTSNKAMKGVQGVSAALLAANTAVFLGDFVLEEEDESALKKFIRKWQRFTASTVSKDKESEEILARALADPDDHHDEKPQKEFDITIFK